MRSLYLFDNDFKLLKAIKYEQILVLDNKKELRENELPVDRLTAQYVMKEYPHYDNVYYFGTKDANNKVIIYYLAQASDDTRDVYLEGIQLAYKELKHYIIENKRPTMNAKAMIEEILKGSDWDVGYVPNTLTLFSSFYQQTMLDSLSQIAGLFGLNFSFYVELENNKIVRKFVEARFPNYRKTLKRFTHDSNLLKVVSKIDRTDTITALIGYGKGVESGDGYGRKLTIENVEWKIANGDPVDKPLGQKYIELKDLTARIGIKQIDNSIHPLIAQKDYNDIEDDEELIKAIYKDLLLLSRDKYEYETTISDIGYVELGEVASIHNHKLGIHYEVSYFDINYNLLNIDKTEVKLGDKINKSRSERTLAAKREQEKILVELNHAITSANGKNTNFYGVNQPAIASENDLWYRDNGDGTVDLLIYKNGVWVEELTDSLFKELRADIEANNQLVNDAKSAADAASQKVDDEVEKMGNELSLFKTDTDKVLSIIKDPTKKGLLSAINQQAGGVLIKVGDNTTSSLLNVTKDNVFIDKGVIQQANIDIATITDALLKNVKFDWATGKTLNAQQVNVTNIDANNITANKTSFVQSAWNAINSSVTIDGNGMMIDGDWGGAINFTRRGQTFYDKIKGQVMGYNYGLYRNLDDPLVNTQMLGIYLASEMGYDLRLGIRKQIDNQNNVYMAIKSAGGTATRADIFGATTFFNGINLNGTAITNASNAGYEVITNSNGVCMKFNNGFKIQWKKMDYVVRSTGFEGWRYPVAFSSVPIAYGNAARDDVMASNANIAFSNVNSTACNVRISEKTNAYTIFVMAMGF